MRNSEENPLFINILSNALDTSLQLARVTSQGALTMPSSVDSQRRRRQRLRAQGKTEILVMLPLEDVEVLDRLRAVQGVASRGDVVASLIRQVTEAGNALKTA